ncbi:hypothetical protein NDN08_000127 [Rhodosorus marinus]|uniref:Uncharacterized protein n=1 Tax=Rhodosorus marinus TaxID=101924 RepID=A0AAV8UED6_9RHOD|nr:hypothetical protein NDN08_000127 [Rhodosorus marinus]
MKHEGYSVLLLGLTAVGCLFVETKAQNLEDEICVPLDTFEDVVNGLLGTIHLDRTNIGPYNKKNKNWIKQKSWVSLGALGSYRGQPDNVKAIIHAAVKTKKNSPVLKLKNYHSLFKMESKFGKKLLEKFGDEQEGWVGKNKKPLRTVEDWVLGYLVDGALTELLFNFDVNNLIDGYLVDQKKYDVGKLLGLADVPFAGLIDKKVLEKLDIVQATKKKNSVCLKYKVPLSDLFS